MKRRDALSALPWLALAVGTALSIAAYFIAANRDAEYRLDMLHIEAISTRQRVESRFDTDIRTLERLARRWIVHGTMSDAEWNEDSTNLLHDKPGLRILSFIDLKGSNHRVATIDENGKISRSQELASQWQAQLKSLRENGLPPTADFHALDFGFTVPIIDNGEYLGILSADYLAKDFFDSLALFNLNVQLEIWQDGELLFPATPIGYQGDETLRQVHVLARPNLAWRVVVYPTDSFVQNTASYRPHFLLLLGFLFTTLVFFAFRGVRKERKRSVSLMQTQKKLQDEIKTRKSVEAKLEEQIQRLKIFGTIDLVITKNTDPNQTLSELTKLLRSLFSADRAFILKPFREADPGIEVLAEDTAEEWPGMGRGGGVGTVSEKDHAILIGLLKTSSRVVVFDPSTGRQLPESATAFDVKSQMVAPLHPSPDQAWLIGIHQCSQARTWTPAEIDLFADIAGRIANPILNLLLQRDLGESEARFRLLAESMPGVIYLCQADEKFTPLYLNSRIETLCGIGPGQMQAEGIGMADLIHPEDLAMVQDRTRAALTERKSYQIEYRLRTNRDTYIWVEEFGCGVYDERNGKLLHLEGFIHDISSRRRATEEREVLARLMQRLLEPMDAKELGKVMASFSRELFHHECFFLASYNYDLGVSRGVYLEDTPHGASHPSEMVFNAHGISSLSTRRRYQLEPTRIDRAADPHDELRPVGDTGRPSKSLLYCPIFWAGTQIGLISAQSYTPGKYTDDDLELLKTLATLCGSAMARIGVVHALERSEKIYRDAIHASAGYAYEISFTEDPEVGSYTFIDPHIEGLLGIAPDKFDPYVFRSLIRETASINDDFGCSADEYGAAFRAGKIPLYNIDLRIETADGTTKWLSDHAVPIVNSTTGKVEGALGILQDITSRRTSEQQLVFANERLELIAQAAATVVGRAPLVEQADSLARKVIDAFQVNACVIRLLQDDGQLHLVSQIGLPAESRTPTIPSDVGVAATIVSRRTVISVRDVREHELTRKHVNTHDYSFQFVSFAGAPMLHEGKVFGIIGLFTTGQVKEFSDADLEHLQIVANNLAVSVMNHNLYQDLDLSRENLREQIEERERAEIALRHSESQYRSIFEISSDGMAIVDQEDRIVECNNAFASIYGSSIDNLSGMQFQDLIYPESRILYQEFLEILETGPSIPTNLTLQPPDNGPIEGEIRAVPLTLSGIPHHVISVRDITERKRTEDIMGAERNVLELIARGTNSNRLLELQLQMLDSRTGAVGGAILTFDHKEKKTHVRAAPELPPELLTRFDGADMQEGDTLIHDAVLTTETLVVERLHEETRWNGDREILEKCGLHGFVACPIQDSGSTRLGVLLLFFGTQKPLEKHHLQLVEVTTALAAIVLEREKAAKENLALENQIQHVQKLESLGVLAGGIAHDFNNLLVAILGNAGLALLDLRPESPARPLVEKIEVAAQRAAELAGQMLAYSGRGRFVVEPLNINGLVEEMTHLLRISISKKAVLKFHLTRNLPKFEGDATQLRQVIMNLVTNASDAVGERSGVITLSTGLQAVDDDYLKSTYMDEGLPPGVYLYAEVSDNGCGMTKETANRIFDPFYTTKMTGRGLGLAAVLGIVRGHKGALKVYSELDRGTTIKVLLPVDATMIEGTSDTPVPADSTPRWEGGGTVLVADDEKSVCAVAKATLERFGFEVIIACDGQEAVDLFKLHRERIVAVLLDLTMPKLNGEEVFREIHTRNPEMPVVLTSGYSEQDAVARFAGKGLAAFIHKPWRPMDLIAKFREILDPTNS